MAVYTDVSDEDLIAFADLYGIGDILSFKGIAEGIENTNYLVRAESGAYILTLYERRVNRADLPFFLGLTEHLAGKGIPCPVPLRGRTDGKWVHELCGRPAALITFLEGMWPKRITPEHCSALGEAVARLHLAGADFEMTRSNDLSLADWRPLLEACLSHADEVERGLGGWLESELAVLEEHWPEPESLPAGVIHADLFPDNVFFLGKRLSGLIDFYFACNDFLIYDLAVCLNAWCFEPDNAFNVTKARRLLSAYRRVRACSDGEMEALPLLARGAALRFLLTRLYDWVNTPKDALVVRKDPREYIAKLRFHQGVSCPAAYGLE